MNRKERIEELQRKNRIKILYEEMKKEITDLQIKDFIPYDERVQLVRKTYKLMDEMNENQTNVRYMLKEMPYEQLIKENIKTINKLQNQKIVVFYERTKETKEGVAISLSVTQVINNIDFIISFSSIANRGCSIFFLDRNMKFGLALWKTEYEELMLYRW